MHRPKNDLAGGLGWVDRECYVWLPPEFTYVDGRQLAQTLFVPGYVMFAQKNTNDVFRGNQLCYLKWLLSDPNEDLERELAKAAFDIKVPNRVPMSEVILRSQVLGFNGLWVTVTNRYNDGPHQTSVTSF